MKHEQGQQLRVKTHIRDYWNSFSFVGLVVAALFFAASVTPSLLPRTYYAQCILSGFAIAVGYSLGVASVLLYQFLELPNPSDWLERISKVLASVGVAAIVAAFLRQMAFWQDSIRELMEMPALETTYLYRTALIAMVSGAALIGGTRLFIRACGMVSEWLRCIVPRRVSIALSTIPIRNVYMQYASDPMVFFSPSLLYKRPVWLSDPRVVRPEAFVLIKAFAMDERLKAKDAYDVYFVVSQYPGGPKELGIRISSMLPNGLVEDAVQILRNKFAQLESIGPVRSSIGTPYFAQIRRNSS